MTNPEISRRSFLRLAGAAVAGLALAVVAPSLLVPQKAQAAGFEEMWDREINSYYPGDPDIAASLGMRMITADDSGLASLDNISTVIAREKYSIEVVFDNLGWYRNFEAKYLAGKKQEFENGKLSAADFKTKRKAFGLCHARGAWATRDSWPFRQPGEALFDIPGLVAPTTREMVEMKIFGFAPIAYYYKYEDEEANRIYFRERALANPGDVQADYMVDLSEGQIGSWWGHVAGIEKRGGSYWYKISKAGGPYESYQEKVIGWAIEPVDYSDSDNPPLPRDGWILNKNDGLQYRSPYYYSPFVRAIYYQEPLPGRSQVLAFLNKNQINYQAA